MPTLVNNLRAIRGPVTSVPMVGASGVVVEPDTQNNQVVVRADETVLWEGDAVSGITLSETALNFDHLKVIFRTNDNISFEDTVFVEQREQFTLMGKYFWAAQNTSYLKMSTFEMNAARTTINILGGVELQLGSNYARNVENRLYIQRVIGVNRIANS